MHDERRRFKRARRSPRVDWRIMVQGSSFANADRRVGRRVDHEPQSRGASFETIIHQRSEVARRVEIGCAALVGWSILPGRSALGESRGIVTLMPSPIATLDRATSSRDSDHARTRTRANQIEFAPTMRSSQRRARLVEKARFDFIFFSSCVCAQSSREIASDSHAPRLRRWRFLLKNMPFSWGKSQLFDFY